MLNVHKNDEKIGLLRQIMTDFRLWTAVHYDCVMRSIASDVVEHTFISSGIL